MSQWTSTGMQEAAHTRVPSFPMPAYLVKLGPILVEGAEEPPSLITGPGHEGLRAVAHLRPLSILLRRRLGAAVAGCSGRPRPGMSRRQGAATLAPCGMP